MHSEESEKLKTLISTFSNEIILDLKINQSLTGFIHFTSYKQKTVQN